VKATVSSVFSVTWKDRDRVRNETIRDTAGKDISWSTQNTVRKIRPSRWFVHKVWKTSREQNKHCTEFLLKRGSEVDQASLRGRETEREKLWRE